LIRIVAWCLANRPVVILFSLLLMAGGVFSIFRLNQELLPDVSFPSVYVVTADPGAGPEVVDRDVSQPIATALSGLPHLKHVRTTSSQGFSQVEAEFSLDTTSKEDQDAVNQRLGQVTLPAGAGKPLVETFSFTAFPTMTYSLVAADGDLVRATREAKEVVAPALLSVPGAAQVRVVGGERRAILVSLDPARLASRQVAAAQVAQALGAANADIPAGETLQGTRSLPVEVVGSVHTAAELRALVVGTAATAPGKPPAQVTLGELATVAEGTVPVNGISRTDGSPSLSIQVLKTSDANAVALSKAVRDRVAGLHLGGDRLEVTSDAAEDIKGSLNGLLEEGLLGALLAVTVIFLFLRSLRATLVTAVSLPTSVLVALAGTHLAGYSLNILTLAGLTIAVGRIVDDAIVVLENSYRHLQEGQGPLQAALNGATEVSSAVISSTLTTVAVFLPIGVVGGIISRFFLPFSITVTISLLASLLVALTLIPVLVSLFLQWRGPGRPRRSRLVDAYRPLLRWSLARGWHKALVGLVALLLLAGSFLPLLLNRVPINFFSTGHSGVVQGTVTLAPGTTTAETSSRLRSFEEAAQADANVRLVTMTTSSSDYGGYIAGYLTNVARLTVLVRDRKQAPQTVDRLKRKLDALYGTGNSQLVEVSYGPPASRFTASVSGRDDSALRAAADRLVRELREDGELTNVKSDAAAEKPELLVSVDNSRAAVRGLDPQRVAQAIGQALGERQIGTLGVDGPVLVLRLDPAAVTSDKLANLPLLPGVPLKDVATIAQGAAPPTIARSDGAREVTVSADFLTEDTNGASSRAQARLSRIALPSGVTLRTGGARQDITDSFITMFQAIAVAVVIVFLILVAFFRSIVTPVVILLTMPLALIGALLALFLTQQPLGLPALLGVLMVFGIVVSNAILLVDFAERARRQHPVLEALELAATTRLRPILMTAVATVVALLPIAIGLSGSGSGLISQSLAVVVEGGLVSSTGLTLIVIPVVYSLVRRRRVPAPAAPRNGESAPWRHFRETVRIPREV
jgi:HAE1 family hydrophobic/amphiphilic exporter-1